MSFLTELERRLKAPLPGDAAHARFSPRPPRGGAFARVAPGDARQAAALILLYPNVEGRTLRSGQATATRASDAMILMF